MSFLRKQQSRKQLDSRFRGNDIQGHWIPTFVGMTSNGETLGPNKTSSLPPSGRSRRHLGHLTPTGMINVPLQLGPPPPAQT